MKISKLHINSFRHLENLDFDFTYPEDFHIAEKRGKPLDKICFIGQSATGKTSLLELINKDVNGFLKTELDSEGDLWINFHNYDCNLKLSYEEDTYEYLFGVFLKNGIPLDKSKIQSSIIQYLFNENTSIFHITSDILSNQNLKVFEDETVILIEKYKGLKNSIKNNHYRLIFDSSIGEEIWISLLEDNVKYLQNFLQFATELINSGSVLDSSSQKKVNNWKSVNKNPLLEFSEKFNTILEKIHLEVDLINTKNIIPLKNKVTGENIPIQNISTGTKQLLLTALPLYKLDTKDSIILIDEPERSLYPDMQMDLMEYYQNLALEAQFIVATHSPFIAASFEPEERFILYFDKEGKVAVRRGCSPIGDDPNDMLKNDFGVNYYNKFGEEAYKKYLNLKANLAKEKDPIKKKDLLLETVKLGDTYNF
jgi:energy-coupling factor transporter ATP-binding protein EcfA2